MRERDRETERHRDRERRRQTEIARQTLIQMYAHTWTLGSQNVRDVPSISVPDGTLCPIKLAL